MLPSQVQLLLTLINESFGRATVYAGNQAGVQGVHTSLAVRTLFFVFFYLWLTLAWDFWSLAVVSLDGGVTVVFSQGFPLISSALQGGMLASAHLFLTTYQASLTALTTERTRTLTAGPSL